MSDVHAFLEAIHAADRTVMDPVHETIPALAVAATQIAARMQSGGRCFYLGAGTSGRLAVLDAAELGPTFGVDRDRVIALIAGGPRAVTEAIEGAEDDANAAAADLSAHRFAATDALVVLAASGTTPFALGGLRHARRLGSFTVAITCATGSPIGAEADVGIEIPTGPEILAGSTRMKAGTAQKLVLNMLSTAVMNELGLIHRGEMVAMRPTNAKLRERAVRIVRDVTGAADERARALLAESNWSLPHALVRAAHHVDLDTATRHLATWRGSVREALENPPEIARR